MGSLEVPAAGAGGAVHSPRGWGGVGRDVLNKEAPATGAQKSCFSMYKCVLE